MLFLVLRGGSTRIVPNFGMVILGNRAWAHPLNDQVATRVSCDMEVREVCQCLEGLTNNWTNKVGSCCLDNQKLLKNHVNVPFRTRPSRCKKHESLQ